MKRLIFIFMFAFAHWVSAFAQTNTIDRLISKIDNNKLYGTCHYAWVLENSSKEADSLIHLAQKVNSDLKSSFKESIVTKLIPLVTDTSKGIIAHYILSNIWTKFTKQKSVFLNSERSSLSISYNYNDLEFFWTEARGMYAENEELKKTQNIWRLRFGEYFL